MLKPTDPKSEQQKVIRNGLFGTLFCVAILAASCLFLPRLFVFPQDFEGAMKLALQANAFIALWVVIGVRWVARVRFRSVEDMPGSAYSRPSRAIAVPVTFLQNSLEQAVIAIAMLLALASVATGSALAFLPAVALLFAIGRVAFLLGYPKGAGARAFGMVVTAVPALAAFLLTTALLISNAL